MKATTAVRQRLSAAAITFRVLREARVLVGLRPDKYFRIAAAIRHEGTTNTVGIAISARRNPQRMALVDEIGTLTYQELDERADALATALQRLPSGCPQTVAIMCRNHRGFVEALAAADRLGADTVLLNTSFAGPALTTVLEREQPDVLIHDEEFTDGVMHAVGEKPAIPTLIGWAECEKTPNTLDAVIAGHRGSRPEPTGRKGRLILLTSGTTGTPKGARRSGGGGPGELTAVLSRVPWRAEETIVVAAPMFHAWGYGQLVLGSLLGCTLVVQRRFDAAVTMALVDKYLATGLSVVPVMIDRIMALETSVLDGVRGDSLRFVTASGSRMRANSVTAFMNRFGDVVYNNYNATEVGMIAAATPADLRDAPDTAGRPLMGVEVRILDAERHRVCAGQVGTIFARSSSQFDSYTSGATKEKHEGFMASGDVGYLDDTGRLFVVGRDDDMIVSGGENVYPIEVEATLDAHPDVSEAAVLGVDDEEFGQRLVAFVVPNRGATLNSDTLKRYVREHLASYKVPRTIKVIDELPRTNTGKVLKRELLKDACKGDQRRSFTADPHPTP